MSEVESSVVYRKGPITVRDYDDAIEALQNARYQLIQLDTDEYEACCAVCGDTDHYHQLCHHNPLVVARRRADDEHTWRCYHCGFITHTHEEAAEHFGLSPNTTPACLRDTT